MTIVRESRLQGVSQPRRRSSGSSSTRVGGGAYRGSGSELFVVHLPGGRVEYGPTVIWCHASGSSGLESSSGPASDLAERIAALGCPVICADLGGPTPWANDDAIDAVDDAIAYGAAQFGTRTDRIGFVGVSMGGMLMANWAARHYSQVSFLYGIVPVLNTQGIIDGPAGALIAPQVYAAYTNQAGWLAAAPTHDPVQSFVGKPLEGLGERFRIDADLNDGLILNADYDAFLLNAPSVDFRWFPGNHTTALDHDHAEVARWVRDIVQRYG